jgi:hypothetical protein
VQLQAFKIFTLLFFYSNIFSQEKYTPSSLTAKKVKGNIKVDGYLYEKEWKESTTDSLNFEMVWDKIERPDVKTKIFVIYDDENLYFGIKCYEKNVKEIRASKLNPRESYKIFLQDDYIALEIYKDTASSESYSFAVNPFGIKNFSYIIYIGSTSQAIFKDIVWDADAKINDSCWTAEISIPFKSIEVKKDVKYIKTNIYRIRRRDILHYYIWSPHPVGKISDPVLYAGKIYLEKEIKITYPFEFLPYFVGSKEEKIVYKLGLTAKYYLTYTKIFNFALNPDYSQIETDAWQIDVNTISAIYYPEKRPFFSEGSEMFRTPFEIFYTRTINNPLFALKFYGELEKFKISYISAYDRNTIWIIPYFQGSFYVESNEKSFSNIFCLKREFLKSSYARILLTDREVKESFSRIFSFDGTFKFLKYHYFTYQFLYSSLKELENKDISFEFDGEKLYGKGFYLNYGFSFPKFYLDLLWEGISPDFRADNGFLSSNDYEKRESKIGINYFFKENPLIQGFSPQFRIFELRKFLKGRYHFEKNIYLNINFKKLTGLTFGYKVYSRKYQNIDFKKLWDFILSIYSSPFKNINFSFVIDYGRQINYAFLNYGNVLSYSTNFNFYIRNLKIDFGYSRYTMFEKDYKNKIYNQKIFNNEISYSFTRFTSFRIINQYNSTTSEYFLYPLFSFEPTPFTLFYFGSNHKIIKNSQKDYKIFLKIQYQIKL